MTRTVGDSLPQGSLLRIGPDGPETVDLKTLTEGRKVVIFAVIGAFTGTCSDDHLPSFLRQRAGFADRGVDEVICISVNDPFVMQAWDTATGAGAAGVTLLADPDGAFTRAMGMEFDAPAVGFVGRSRRYALLAENGVVTRLLVDDDTRIFDRSSGEALLAEIPGTGRPN
ncbi:MAG: redoxin family protein [Marinibacterium sp.]